MFQRVLKYISSVVLHKLSCQIREFLTLLTLRFDNGHLSGLHRSAQIVTAADHSLDSPQSFKARTWNRRLKCWMDITLSATALILLSPLLLMVTLLMKLAEKGPVLFSHERVGSNGEYFKCYKFRTMIIDSQKRLEKHLAENPQAAREWEETQKLRNDPRITPIGHFLRKSSLDELPQLINILKGEMSIVGPRPVTSKELKKYGKSKRYYLSVKPGLTGLWQVSGRNSLSYKRRVALDRVYVSKWSFLQDINLIIKTVPALLKTDQTS